MFYFRSDTELLTLMGFHLETVVIVWILYSVGFEMYEASMFYNL